MLKRVIRLALVGLALVTALLGPISATVYADCVSSSGTVCVI